MPTPFPGYEERVRQSFARQRLMATLGAELLSVAPGMVQVALPFREDLTQQHGTLHAGTITALVDTACGFAAYSLMPPEAAVLSAEFKLNLLSPAAGERFVATGRVLKAGRTLTVCSGEVHAGDKLIAVMQATMMTIEGRGITG